MVTALLLFVPPPAIAKKSDNKQAAIKLAESGIELFKQKNYADALDLFLKSHQLHPIPVVVWNTGRCYEELGYYAKAIDIFTKYLEYEKSPEKRAFVNAKIIKLGKHHVGILVVTLNPAGVTLTSMGVTLTPDKQGKISLNAGSHEITASRKGYLSKVYPIQVKAGAVVPLMVSLKRVEFAAELFAMLSGLLDATDHISQTVTVSIAHQVKLKRTKLSLLIIGAAVLAGGGTLHVLAYRDWSEVKSNKGVDGVYHDISQSAAYDVYTSSRTKSWVAYGMYGLGAALWATALVIHLKYGPGARLSVGIIPGGDASTMVFVGARF